MRAPIAIRHKEINGLVTFDMDSFQDERGLNAQIYEPEDSEELTNIKFSLDSYSTSKKGVLRGFHYDFVNYKLIQVLFGQIQFFVIDNRQNSPTYGGVKEFLFDYKKPTRILVPSGCANAHLTLSENCVFFYKWSVGYRKQEIIKWNDLCFSDRIKWKISEPILSERDR